MLKTGTYPAGRGRLVFDINSIFDGGMVAKGMIFDKKWIKLAPLLDSRFCSDAPPFGLRLLLPSIITAIFYFFNLLRGLHEYRYS